MVICFGLLKVLIAVTLFQFNLISDTEAEGSVYYDCPNTTKYTDNSTYQLNLNTFFSNLSSGNAINSLFNNTIIGGNGSDATYGQFLCRGDITIEACRRCVQKAPAAINQKCPDEKEAYVWYDDKCMLRYNNISFFGILAKELYKPYRSPSTVTNPENLVQVVKEVFDELINRTSKIDGPVKFFATRTVNFTSNLSTKLYHLAQCTPDLSSSDCDQCLRTAFDTLELAGNQGARVLSPSCNIRYESDPFYIITDSTTQPGSPTPHSPPSEGNRGLLVAAMAVILVTFIIILFTILFYLLRERARMKQCVVMENTEADSLQYELRLIRVATNDFSADNKIGEGGFGEVFKGTLNGEQIAVKRLSMGSGQGEQEFKNEVTVVAKLQHRNLVRLLGYCLDEGEKILIYEFVPNKSLDFILFDQEKQQLLDWSRRYKIIGGVIRGILYLHEDSRLRIIHRDLKASNVLLDNDMNAKISDFGMARVVGLDESQIRTNRVVGTFGYMSPEYAMHGQFSTKSDVFSFGVLVLEIISGKKNNSFHLSGSSEDLRSYAWKLWRDGRAVELVDPTLGDSFVRNEVIRCIHMGLLCVQEDPEDRPTIASIILMLSNYSIALPLPHEPAFFLGSTTMTMPKQPDSDESSSNTKSLPWSLNEVSITELYPR